MVHGSLSPKATGDSCAGAGAVAHDIIRGCRRYSRDPKRHLTFEVDWPGQEPTMEIAIIIIKSSSTRWNPRSAGVPGNPGVFSWEPRVGGDEVEWFAPSN